MNILHMLDDLIKNNIVDDDMNFSKASVDPKLVELQSKCCEFITSVILKHESDFYKLISNQFDGRHKEILGETGEVIFRMIIECTTKFYNNIYADIQYHRESPCANLIVEIVKCADYGPHILLDKLYRLTLDAHTDVDRDQLSTNNIDAYQYSVLNQINVYLISKNLLHVLSRGEGEDIEFINIPEGQCAFNAELEKSYGKKN